MTVPQIPAGGHPSSEATVSRPADAVRVPAIPPAGPLHGLGGDRYVCPTTGETESLSMGGFDVCCDHPECPGGPS